MGTFFILVYLFEVYLTMVPLSQVRQPGMTAWWRILSLRGRVKKMLWLNPKFAVLCPLSSIYIVENF